jgi:hypothetical protein
MTTDLDTSETTRTARQLAKQFIEFLETGVAAGGLFAPDLFTDFTMPTWRMQAGTAEGSIDLRRAGHPMVGQVPRSRLDLTERGFVLEVEEVWQDRGEDWYCRELFRADVVDGSITELSIYCTGDWDSARVAEHRAAVTLLRL